MITDYLSTFGGIDLFYNKYLTETEEYEEEISLSFKERWIEPLINWQSQPFEPWIKTRIETKYRQVPMKKIIQHGNSIFMHPAIGSDLERYLWKN